MSTPEIGPAGSGRPTSPSFRTLTWTSPDENGAIAVPAATPAAHSALYCNGSIVVTVK